jgi:uncharacterized protein YjbJ (UPF0337 family)
MRRAVLAVMLTMAGAWAMAGCEDEGPAERAGERIDDAIEDARDAVEDARDDVRDAVEDARESLEEDDEN